MHASLPAHFPCELCTHRKRLIILYDKFGCLPLSNATMQRMQLIWWMLHAFPTYRHGWLPKYEMHEHNYHGCFRLWALHYWKHTTPSHTIEKVFHSCVKHSCRVLNRNAECTRAYDRCWSASTRVKCRANLWSNTRVMPILVKPIACYRKQNGLYTLFGTQCQWKSIYHKISMGLHTLCEWRAWHTRNSFATLPLSCMD